MPAMKDLSVTLDPINTNNPSNTSNNTSDSTQPTSSSRKSSSSTPATATSGSNAVSLKKAKWHLGIRSQSKPQDIMNEVFKAMKELGMEWKFCNNSMYSLRARRKIADTDRYVKLGLQLYQVDHRSYLLDFRNLNVNTDGHHPSLCTQDGFFSEQNESENKLEQNRTINWEFGETENMTDTSAGDAASEVMEFFEATASLIRTLAPDSVPKTNPLAST